MAQLYLPDEAPASTPEPPKPPPVGDKDRPRDRRRPPEPDDEAPGDAANRSEASAGPGIRRASPSRAGRTWCRDVV